ncbi:hypothetical protein CQW23_03683 [Capsicum baccatum]|uniref:Uncharacterized protein n=1 Tax=Capsicum baccatum TaxID=33114 RepID=A0A2G2XCI9_CAPBA|nr:hypothetical protein CQW23_03683 [Capsicum baccatum]
MRIEALGLCPPSEVVSLIEITRDEKLLTNFDDGNDQLEYRINKLEKKHYPSIASDVESVASDVESVAIDVESVAIDVESITTDVESVVIDVESIATNVEFDGIHQISLSGGFICSNNFSICCNINNSINYK